MQATLARSTKAELIKVSTVHTPICISAHIIPSFLHVPYSTCNGEAWRRRSCGRVPPHRRDHPGGRTPSGSGGLAAGLQEGVRGERARDVLRGGAGYQAAPEAVPQLQPQH